MHFSVSRLSVTVYDLTNCSLLTLLSAQHSPRQHRKCAYYSQVTQNCPTDVFPAAITNCYTNKLALDVPCMKPNDFSVCEWIAPQHCVAVGEEVTEFLTSIQIKILLYLQYYLNKST